MVTRAAKDLLKNTIRSTDYHNKLLEEEEMWRHWELEKGLTMMVTDDYLKRMRMDEYPDPRRSNGCQRPRLHRHRNRCHRRRKKSSTPENGRPKRPNDYQFTRELVEIEEQDPDRRMRMDEYPDPRRSNGCQRPRCHRHRNRCHRHRKKSSTPENGRPKRPIDYQFTRELVEIEEQDPDRWGHSGYIELYPEEFQVTVPSSSANESPPGQFERSNDNDGSEDDEDKKSKSHQRSHKRKHKKTKHKRHHRCKRKSSHFDTDSETSELRQVIRNEQRKKRGLDPLRRKRRRDSSDSDVRIVGISAPRKLNSDVIANTS